MKPETRQLAIGGLILIGLACIIVGYLSKLTEWIPVVSTVVVGIVGVLKEKGSDTP